jgi:hypothetical protein
MRGVLSLPSFVLREAIDDSATTATQPATAAEADVRQPALDPSVNHRIEGTSHPGRDHPRQARRGRCSVTRRRRLDLELLLIIRRAERQAHLCGRSRSDEFDALMAVQRAALIDPHVPSRLARPRPPAGWTQGPIRGDRVGGGLEDLDRHA